MVLKGVIETIIFRNSENGYSVIIVGGADFSITAVGVMPPISEGETVEMRGEIIENNKYGEQFKVNSIKVVLPTALDSIAKYLASGLFPGVGEKTADSIVEQFEDKTFEIIENEPLRLAGVKNVSTQKAMTIHDTFINLKDMQNTVIYLQEHEISLNLALKIYKAYGKATRLTIEENPYKLIEDIDGIGFFTADKIAQKIGINFNSNFRVTAGIIYILKNIATAQGHTFMPKDELITAVGKLLTINCNEEGQTIESCIFNLEISGHIIILSHDGLEAVMFHKYYLTEMKIANKLISLKNCASEVHLNFMADIEQFEYANNIKMHENQIEAVKSAVLNGVNIVTGGPGTGKTTIIKCILSIFKKHGFNVQLCAPTGRAAKRLSEATDEDAKTIHRLLDLDFKDGKGYFTFNEYTKLEADVVIVDEVSMCDEYVFEALLSAIESGKRIVMVGDKDQLPSVGAGNILADIIECGVIPISYLTYIYRQGKESMIVTNAHRINNGEIPIIKNKDSDFLFDNIKDSERILARIVDMVTSKIPNYLNITSADIQVLCPLKKGICGVNNMNLQLQNSINPPHFSKAELKQGENVFRVGDKVIHTMNDYELEWTRENETGKGVFNGDIGYIKNVSKGDNTLTVQFDDERVATYKQEKLELLSLAYAVSVHKSQGSEFDVVVIALMSGSPMMLTRNLLYTAVTRAKKMSVLVGDAYNLEKMVKNNYTAKRYTLLTRFLLEENARLSAIL